MFRKYAYLMALARERHFGRAAAVCNVSQPTLSNAIRQLEEELGVPIVERGQRFQGFTPQGQRVLKYARRILAEQEELTQELHAGADALGRAVAYRRHPDGPAGLGPSSRRLCPAFPASAHRADVEQLSRHSA